MYSHRRLPRIASECMHAKLTCETNIDNLTIQVPVYCNNMLSIYRECFGRSPSPMPWHAPAHSAIPGLHDTAIMDFRKVHHALGAINIAIAWWPLHWLFSMVLTAIWPYYDDYYCTYSRYQVAKNAIPVCTAIDTVYQYTCT